MNRLVIRPYALGRVMKYALLIVGLLIFVGTVAAKVTANRDVPAIAYTTPASFPCNGNHGSGMISLTNCITVEETHYKCADTSRFLMTAEDGSKHCLSFKGLD
jgi:hypothetical protein